MEEHLHEVVMHLNRLSAPSEVTVAKRMPKWSYGKPDGNLPSRSTRVYPMSERLPIRSEVGGHTLALGRNRTTRSEPSSSQGDPPTAIEETSNSRKVKQASGITDVRVELRRWYLNTANRDCLHPGNPPYSPSPREG